MTMLDRMRRHKNWLKWSLAIVVVAFVALYIPSFMKNQKLDGASPYGVVATVEGRDITVARFRRVYQQQMQAYRNAYGGSMDERLLRQLGVDQRIVQQLIEEEAALAEARRQGITASDTEVRARILALPAFQENGHFIGNDRYRQLLQIQNPPINPGEFEEEVRRGVLLEKLQGALTDWITVADADVTAEFNRRNEKVKLAVVAFPADKFKDDVAVTDAEVASHFEANKDTYKIPEKRKIKYALIDLQGIRQRTTVSAQDVQRYYEDNQQQYSTPEQVRASHILLKTEGKDDAAVKKQAEDVLAKVKGGADFAALATKLSEDEVSASKGGDLDFFAKGAMVKEFDDMAFSLKPGETSGLVKSQFGYHIIRVTDKKPASTRSLDESRVQIEEILKSERAQKEAERISTELAGKLTKPQDLDTVAKGRGLTVNETGFFARDEPIAGIGMAPAVGNRAFEMKAGEVSEAIRSQNGFVFITVTGTQESRVPSLDEVKARVRQDVQKTKAVEAARQKATAIAAQLKAATDFAAAAKTAGLEAKTTDLIVRGAAVPDVGMSPAVDAAAFALPQGGVSDPIVTDTGAVIVKVLEKKTPTADELKTGRDAVKSELVNQQKQRFYGSYMTKARERMTIKSNPQVIAQVIG
jgi:peptidyl-prolyl cis-trans isomerase D